MKTFTKIITFQVLCAAEINQPSQYMYFTQFRLCVPLMAVNMESDYSVQTAKDQCLKQNNDLY